MNLRPSAEIGQNQARTKRRPGRPSWSPPDLKVVESLAESGLTLEQIADHLSISRATLFRSKKRTEALRAAVERGHSKRVAGLVNRQHEQIRAGNLPATIAFLKSRGWGKKLDGRTCPDPWMYALEYLQDKERTVQALTPEEHRRFRELLALAWKRQNEQPKVPDLTCEERRRFKELLGLDGKRKKAAAVPEHGADDAGSPDHEKPGKKPKSGRTGRPPWRPPDLRIVENLAERGLWRTQIAACLGIDPATLFKKMKEDPEFDLAITRGQANAEALAVKKLFEHAMRGNVTAIIFGLQRLIPEKYARKRLPEHRHSLACLPEEVDKKEDAAAKIAKFWTADEKEEYVALLETAEKRWKNGRL